MSKQLLKWMFRTFWQFSGTVAIYSLFFPHLNIWFAMAFALFLLLFDFFSPEGPTPKQVRILNMIFTPLVFILITAISIYNFNARLYNLWHIIALIIMSCEIAVRTYNIFKPHNQLVTWLERPTFEDYNKS